MEILKVIQNKNDAKFVWERKDAYRLDRFLIMDLEKLFVLHNVPAEFRRRKKYHQSFLKTFGATKAKELSPSILRSWFDQMREENDLTERTLAQIKCQLNLLFKWLEKEGIINENPLKSIKFKRNQRPKRERKIFKEAELKKLLASAKTFDADSLYPFIYALAHTGARRSEIMNLRKCDVDEESQTFTFDKTKNGSSRTIKVPSSLMSLVQQNVTASEYVFKNRYGNKLNRGYVQRLINGFKDYYKESGDWNYHDLRHSFAYNFLRIGGEMYQLQAVLGHKSIHMTIDLYGNYKSKDVEKPSPYDF